MKPNPNPRPDPLSTPSDPQCVQNAGNVTHAIIIRADDGVVHTFPHAHFVRGLRQVGPERAESASAERLVLTFSLAEVTITGVNLRRVEEGLASGRLAGLRPEGRRQVPNYGDHARIFSIRVAVEEPR